MGVLPDQSTRAAMTEPGKEWARLLLTVGKKRTAGRRPLCVGSGRRSVSFFLSLRRGGGRKARGGPAALNSLYNKTKVEGKKG